MASMGQIFRQERERRGLTVLEAADATHIKPTHIDALEQGDFSGIVAPIYARGFIKLYAELLHLDPAPLLQEYEEQHAPREPGPVLTEPEVKKSVFSRRRTLIPESASPEPSVPESSEEPPARVVSRPVSSSIPDRAPQPGGTARRILPVALALALAGLAIWSLRACLNPAGEKPSISPPVGVAPEPPPAKDGRPLPIIEEPPAPYLPDAPAGAAPPAP